MILLAVIQAHSNLEMTTFLSLTFHDLTLIVARTGVWLAIMCIILCSTLVFMTRHLAFSSRGPTQSQFPDNRSTSHDPVETLVRTRAARPSAVQNSLQVPTPDNNDHPNEAKLAPLLTLSVVIPAQNEEANVSYTVEALYGVLMAAHIPFEILVVNDHSADSTEAVLQHLCASMPGVRYVNNARPKGFGRAIRAGLEQFKGDAVCITMADASDDPNDVVAYYHKLQDGYECVFGSRFMHGSRVVDYPTHKLVVNRLANAFIKVLFHLSLNDTTNAFKAYRREVIYGVSPIVSPHFNITVELPLKAITRGYSYAVVPINWYNRKFGVSKLKIREMGSRYLYVVLITWLEQALVRSDYSRASRTGSIGSDTIAISETTPRMRTVAAPSQVSATAEAAMRQDATPVVAKGVSLGSLAQLTVFIVPVTLISLILWGIWNRTPHVPFWDEWQNIVIFLHFKQGTLQFADFWAFHNEHRIVIPRMLYLALVILTHWNEQVIMSFDLALAVIESALLLAAIRRSLNSSGWMIALVAPISLLVFSLGQYENWLWAFQITFICTVLGVACCVYAFARQPASWMLFLLGLAGAFLAAWSSAGGTMAWLAFLPAAWRAGRIKGGIWTLTAAAVLITYFQGFPHSTPFHFSLKMLGFSLGYLGAPLGDLNVTWSLIAGILSVMFVLVNLVMYWRMRGSGVPLDAWFCLALFALAVDGITTLGRYELFGFSDFLTSRYQVFSVLWWVSVLTLAAINVRSLQMLVGQRRATQRPSGEALEGATASFSSTLARPLMAANVTAIVLCCLAAFGTSAGTWSALKGYLYTQRLDEVCVANYQTASDACLHGFVWDSNYLRAEAQILDEYHQSIFANDVGSTRPLVLYLNKHTGDRWVTTSLVDTHQGYSEVQWLGLVYVNAHVGTSPLYQCLSNVTHLHFLSMAETCGGQQEIAVEGWIYTSSSPYDASAPLYRCTVGNSSYVSTDASCGGNMPEGVLGYILTQDIPWQG